MVRYSTSGTDLVTLPQTTSSCRDRGVNNVLELLENYWSGFLSFRDRGHNHYDRNNKDNKLERLHTPDVGEYNHEDGFKYYGNYNWYINQLENEESLSVNKNNFYNIYTYYDDTTNLDICQQVRLANYVVSFPFLVASAVVLGHNLDNSSRINLWIVINDKTIIKLLIGVHHHFKMGTTCSTNVYDRREWSSTTSLNLFERKHGRLRKRAQSDPTYNTTQASPDVCTCHQRGIVSKEDGHSTSSLNCLSSPTISKQTASLSRNDVFKTIGGQVPSSRLSSHANSLEHFKLSKIIGSGRSRTTASCDVSPHRLLTRRSNSPSYRPAGFDFRSANGSCYSDRYRSQSWSNCNLGYKDNFRAGSPTLRTSVLCQMRSPKRTSTRTSGGIVSRSPHTSTNTLPQHSITPTQYEEHKPGCPLYVKPSELSHISASQTHSKLIADLDETWTPITRRRAASESQTMRPGRQLSQTSESEDLDQSHDHNHVHWADEETGSSLSTSVFLSSIRPRSYSHGAMDSAPNRPILKKVAGI